MNGPVSRQSGSRTRDRVAPRRPSRRGAQAAATPLPALLATREAAVVPRIQNVAVQSAGPADESSRAAEADRSRMGLFLLLCFLWRLLSIEKGRQARESECAPEGRYGALKKRFGRPFGRPNRGDRI